MKSASIVSPGPTRRLSPPLTAQRVTLVAAILMAAAACGTQAQTIHLVSPLPGGSFSQPTGISADGSLISNLAWGDWSAGTPDMPSRWTVAGGTQSLGLPPNATAGWATGMSGDGTTLVGTGWGLTSSPFRYRNGAFEELVLPSGIQGGDAVGVNFDGNAIVGSLWDGSTSTAYRWTPAGIENLGVLANGNYSYASAISSDGQVVVGSGDTPKGDRGFRWTSGGGMEALKYRKSSDNWAFAAGVSGDGSTVVGLSGGMATRWVGNHVQGLGTLSTSPFATSVAYSTSADGSLIFGTADTDSGLPAAFVWSRHGGMLNLEEYLESQGVDLTGWDLWYANASSADGSTLAGGGFYNGEFHGWVLTDFVRPVPEASPGLTGAGLVALAMVKTLRRRRD